MPMTWLYSGGQRSKVKVTACSRVVEGIQVNVKSTFKSIFSFFLRLVMTNCSGCYFSFIEGLKPWSHIIYYAALTCEIQN